VFKPAVVDHWRDQFPPSSWQLTSAPPGAHVAVASVKFTPAANTTVGAPCSAPFWCPVDGAAVWQVSHVALPSALASVARQLLSCALFAIRVAPCTPLTGLTSVVLVFVWHSTQASALVGVPQVALPVA